MVICKYFLQGNCRFGNRCRFEHSDLRSHYSERNESQHYRTNKFDNSTFKQSCNVEDAVQLVMTEVNNLLQNEKCGQWPLSCFAPLKDRGCYPGIEDYSPEEIRWLFYNAMKSGNVEHCKRRIQELFTRHKIEKNNLLNCNRDMFTVIKNMLSGEIPQSTSSFKMNINTAPSTGPSLPSFSFNLAQHGLQPNTNLFGNSSQPNPNLFGNSSQPNANLFGNSSQQFVQSNSNVPSLFGSYNNSTSQQPSANFQNLQKSIFGNNSSTAEDLPPESNFNFKTNRNSVNVFGNSKLNEFPQSTQQTSVTGINFSFQQPNGNYNYQEKGIYTPIEDLTDAEVKMFKMHTFSMGQVPINPPSRDLSNH